MKVKFKEIDILDLNNLKGDDKIVVKNKKNELLFEGYLMSFMVKIMNEKQQNLFDFMSSCERTGDKLYKVL